MHALVRDYWKSLIGKTRSKIKRTSYGYFFQYWVVDPTLNKRLAIEVRAEVFQPEKLMQKAFRQRLIYGDFEHPFDTDPIGQD